MNPLEIASATLICRSSGIAYGQFEGTFVNSTYPAFAQLNAQITRWFRKFSVYVGGENLTGYKQKNPIINAANPWSSTFDPTMVWGPVEGARAYIGIRYKF